MHRKETSTATIVILGGYGNFGARISRALVKDDGFHIIVAGRNLALAKNLVGELGANATAAYLDVQDASLSEKLVSLNAKVVIHTAGPFQEQAWSVPEAVARAGAHYIDLADGRRWVCDFPKALDSFFKDRGLCAITGASTVPALSSAVISKLSGELSRLDSIDICIAPAQTAPRGVATLGSVLSYCGEPIQIWRNGQWVSEPGWSRPTQIGFARMKSRHGALCDIPDLELFPAYYAGVKTVMFRAALEVGFTQWMFAALSALRHRRLLPKLRGLAGALQRSASLFDRFGSSLGGMVVRVGGLDASGSSCCLAWHIAADHDHGPEIPCMAAILLARRMTKNQIPFIGARPCIELVSLEEFEPEFSKWKMVTDIIKEPTDGTSAI